MDLFAPEEWAARGMDLAFTPDAAFGYPIAPRFAFRPHPSILDRLIWAEPGAIRVALAPMVPSPA